MCRFRHEGVSYPILQTYAASANWSEGPPGLLQEAARGRSLQRWSVGQRGSRTCLTTPGKGTRHQRTTACLWTAKSSTLARCAISSSARRSACVRNTSIKCDPLCHIPSVRYRGRAFRKARISETRLCRHRGHRIAVCEAMPSSPYLR